jgi:hypothetical protein
MRALQCIVIFAVAVTVMVPEVEAQTCSEQIDEMARQHALSADPPRAPPPSGSVEAPATEESRGLPPESLSRSGGVIAPPGEGRGRVIEPPRAGSNAMPTAPPVPPQTSEAPSTGAAELGAAKRAQMQSLLEGARAAARQGNEAECLDRLEEARAIPDAR